MDQTDRICTVEEYKSKRRTLYAGYTRLTLCRGCQHLRMTLTKTLVFLVLVLASLPQHCTTSPQRVHYDTAGTRSYTGRNCTTKWCGERWRKNVISYYNYTLEDKLVWENRSFTHTINDCSNGAQISSECETITTTTYSLEKVRTVVAVRDKKPQLVRNSEELDLDLILSDNIDTTGQTISDHYPLNQDKIWQLSIPKGCKMRVTFDKFEIESTNKCERDYFSVQTSKRPDEVYVFCDHLSTIVIRRRNRVQFKLHSDNAVNKGGIRARVCLQPLDALESDLSCRCQIKRRRRGADDLQDLDSVHVDQDQLLKESDRIEEQLDTQESVSLRTRREQEPIEHSSIHESQRLQTLKQLQSLSSSHNHDSSS